MKNADRELNEFFLEELFDRAVKTDVMDLSSRDLRDMVFKLTEVSTYVIYLLGHRQKGQERRERDCRI